MYKITLTADQLRNSKNLYIQAEVKSIECHFNIFHPDGCIYNDISRGYLLQSKLLFNDGSFAKTYCFDKRFLLSTDEHRAIYLEYVDFNLERFFPEQHEQLKGTHRQNSVMPYIPFINLIFTRVGVGQDLAWNGNLHQDSEGISISGKVTAAQLRHNFNEFTFLNGTAAAKVRWNNATRKFDVIEIEIYSPTIEKLLLGQIELTEKNLFEILFAICQEEIANTLAMDLASTNELKKPLKKVNRIVKDLIAKKIWSYQQGFELLNRLNDCIRHPDDATKNSLYNCIIYELSEKEKNSELQINLQDIKNRLDNLVHHSEVSALRPKQALAEKIAAIVELTKNHPLQSTIVPWLKFFADDKVVNLLSTNKLLDLLAQFEAIIVGDLTETPVNLESEFLANFNSILTTFFAPARAVDSGFSEDLLKKQAHTIILRNLSAKINQVNLKPHEQQQLQLLFEHLVAAGASDQAIIELSRLAVFAVQYGDCSGARKIFYQAIDHYADQFEGPNASQASNLQYLQHFLLNVVAESISAYPENNHDFALATELFTAINTLYKKAYLTDEQAFIGLNAIKNLLFKPEKATLEQAEQLRDFFARLEELKAQEILKEEIASLQQKVIVFYQQVLNSNFKQLAKQPKKMPFVRAAQQLLAMSEKSLNPVDFISVILFVIDNLQPGLPVYDYYDIFKKNDTQLVLADNVDKKKVEFKKIIFNEQQVAWPTGSAELKAGMANFRLESWRLSLGLSKEHNRYSKEQSVILEKILMLLKGKFFNDASSEQDVLNYFGKLRDFISSLTLQTNDSLKNSIIEIAEFIGEDNKQIIINLLLDLFSVQPRLQAAIVENSTLSGQLKTAAQYTFSSAIYLLDHNHDSTMQLNIHGLLLSMEKVLANSSSEELNSFFAAVSAFKGEQQDKKLSIEGYDDFIACLDNLVVEFYLGNLSESEQVNTRKFWKQANFFLGRISPKLFLEGREIVKNFICCRNEKAIKAYVNFLSQLQQSEEAVKHADLILQLTTFANAQINVEDINEILTTLTSNAQEKSVAMENVAWGLAKPINLLYRDGKVSNCGFYQALLSSNQLITGEINSAEYEKFITHFEQEIADKSVRNVVVAAMVKLGKLAKFLLHKASYGQWFADNDAIAQMKNLAVLAELNRPETTSTEEPAVAPPSSAPAPAVGFGADGAG